MKAYSKPLSLLGVVLILAGGLAYLISPDPEWGIFLNIGIGVALVVAMGVLNPELFRHYGSWLNAIWGSIMVLGIVAMVNFLADLYPQRFDLTAGSLHSLSELTIETLEGLTQDVAALAFMEQGKDEQLESKLKGYAVHSSRFSYEFIDPDKDPERTAEYGVTQYNTLVIESSDKKQQITELKEKEITNALLKVLRERREVVYMSAGHGEKGLGNGEQDYGLIRQRLQEIDYAVEDSLLIARAGEVPEDCTVLVIAGPRTPFLSTEVAAVRRYLERGGAVLVFLDPLYQSGLEGLLREWGVEVGDDFVIDTSGIGSLFGLDFTTPVSVSYGDHPITRKHQGLMTFYQLVRSVRFSAPGGSGIEGVELASTSDQGWAETDLSVLQTKGKATVNMDEGVDRPGPISLAVATMKDAAEGESGGRLVVFGDSDFASNFYFNHQGNGDLALNALSWLAEDESLISIRPREAGYNPIALTESQADWIFWISVVAYPLLIALLGIMVVSRKGRWSLAELAAAGLGIALSLGVVGLVNFMGEHYHYRLDLTEDKLFTLSPKTRDLIEPLEERDRYVTVKTFSAEMVGARFKEILDEYKYLSRNFDYEMLDPQKNALEVKQYGVRERGTSIIEVSGDGKVRTERITEQSEEALSNAIQRALKAEDQKIYFVSGHQEGKLDQLDGEGFSILKGRLKEMNFAVEERLELGREGIPADATIVAVLSPQARFTEAEATAIEAHLQQGRSVLLLLDPGLETGLEALLDEYSIVLGQDFVVDASGLGQLFLGTDVSVPVVTQYGNHPITEKIQQGVMSFFPWARSVSPAAHKRLNPEITVLASSHQSSWGETDLGPLKGSGDGKVDFDPAVDLRGPVALALAVKADADTAVTATGKARIVVFGDADFARNQYFGQQANGELVASSVSWLAEGEDKLSIPDKQPSNTPIALEGTEATTILWTSVFLLPFAIALSGLVIMLRRGYQTYAGGFITWLIINFLGTAVFYFATGVIHTGEGDLLAGEGYLALALVSGAICYGLYRRDMRVWWLALALAIFNAGIGFVAIPIDTIQWLYAALFMVNAAIIVILVWIKKAF
jgi:ABC-type uncharacterized transport system involved in gliding motility auxiliary subunit